jgi:hypothetical protein
MAHQSRGRLHYVSLGGSTRADRKLAGRRYPTSQVPDWDACRLRPNEPNANFSF